MTTEISNELRAKVFHLYSDAEFKSAFDGCTYEIYAVSKTRVYSSKDEHYSIEHSQLLLKPLSQISDEDAREVAKILWGESRKTYIQIKRFAFYIRITLLGRNNEIKIFFNTGFVCQSGVICHTHLIDFLRSRKYALPAHGIPDLFEAGIAVRKEK